MDVLTAALAWHDQGFCVLPTKADGSKAPAVASWTGYQQEGPNRQQVEKWFTGGHAGLGLVCGAISGNLEMLELEGRAVEGGA
jgi:putative DNA primase/helicase